jgi:Tetratricopeptide repeat/Cytochrome c554 and c-prime
MLASAEMRRRVCTLALLLASGCSARAPTATATAHDAATATATTTATTTTATATPTATKAPRAGYVGSAACAECHGKKRAAWQKSWHARALGRGDRDAVVGDFHGAHFAGSSSEAWTRTRDDRFVMRTRGPDGAVADFAVDWVIGGKRMQDDLTIFSDGRWQVLPVYYQVTQRRWVDYTEAKQGRLAPDHPFYWTNFRRMANRECLDCHVTGLDVRFDRATHRWSTAFVDAGVACEDCHGPGARHADTTAVGDIFSPKRAPAELALDACAQCHGPRNPLFPLLDADHRFRPGQRYEDFYDPVVVLIGGKHSGDFFADGRPKSSSFEYQAMLQSACHRQGGATCLSCHTAPHEPHGADELRAPGDETCRGCHAAVFAAGPAHTHHQKPAGQSCVGCHMPKVVAGVLDHFADHAIDVPVPANTARHGVPNACATAGCHADWRPERVEAALTRLWPDAPGRAARRQRLADAFDEKTAAESLQPLLDTIADTREAPTLRGAAAVILAQRFPPRVAAVLPLLSARESILRVKACEALATAHARPAADALFAHVDDSALPVRQAAALALAAVGDARAEAALARLARDESSAHLMQPHLALGMMYARRGDLAGARRELTEVARLTPYFADAIVQLAQVAARQGDPDSARAYLNDVLQLDPNHPAARSLLPKL